MEELVLLRAIYLIGSGRCPTHVQSSFWQGGCKYIPHGPKLWGSLSCEVEVFFCLG